MLPLFFVFIFTSSRHLQGLYILLVEYPLVVLMASALGCRSEIRTRACFTASRRASVWATPHLFNMVCGKMFRIWRRGVTYSNVAALRGELYIISEKVWLRVVPYFWSNLAPRCDIFPPWSHSAGKRSGQTPRSLTFQECSKSILVCWWPLLFVQGPLQYRTCPWVTCKWSRVSSPSLSGKYCLDVHSHSLDSSTIQSRCYFRFVTYFKSKYLCFFMFFVTFFLKNEYLNLPFLYL